MEQQLADFLRKKRGEETYAAFGRRTGLPPSTLFRLEQGQQSLTLGRLEQITKRLKVKLADIFPGF
jgi:transcriptional regulator with XRE-family HTH domain